MRATHPRHSRHGSRDARRAVRLAVIAEKRRPSATVAELAAELAR